MQIMHLLNVKNIKAIFELLLHGRCSTPYIRVFLKLNISRLINNCIVIICNVENEKHNKY